MHLIGYVEKSKWGLPRIVFGRSTLRYGLGKAKYEIKEDWLRLDGIFAVSLGGIGRLLVRLEDIAIKNGCSRIDYIDDRPTPAEIAVFKEAGYKQKDVSKKNISLEKDLYTAVQDPYNHNLCLEKEGTPDERHD